VRILFVADGRSPIALSWMRYWADQHADVFLASTFACEPGLPFQEVTTVPVAFSASRTTRSGARAIRSSRHVIPLTRIRQWVGPLTVPRAARRLREVIRRLQPDLVHAMRIPYEGMLAAEACDGVPLLVSIWGNDFTLHARSTSLMERSTRRTLGVADALHADCRRDVRLAREHGFAEHKPTLVSPSSGGIRADLFCAGPEPASKPVVLHPRGIRAYVQNDAFFRAVPLVLARRPDARFVCIGLAGEPRAEQLVAELRIGHAVALLPPRRHAEMAEAYREAQVCVSATTHDGTPNTLLESMACGCLPVAGDLESIREWIVPGFNGVLVDAVMPESIAGGVLQALVQRHGTRS
jgi:glycosyltransferase involved in cell wall biosynthesis